MQYALYEPNSYQVNVSSATICTVTHGGEPIEINKNRENSSFSATSLQSEFGDIDSHSFLRYIDLLFYSKLFVTISTSRFAFQDGIFYSTEYRRFFDELKLYWINSINSTDGVAHYLCNYVTSTGERAMRDVTVDLENGGFTGVGRKCASNATNHTGRGIIKTAVKAKNTVSMWIGELWTCCTMELRMSETNGPFNGQSRTANKAKPSWGDAWTVTADS